MNWVSVQGRGNGSFGHSVVDQMGVEPVYTKNWAEAQVWCKRTKIKMRGQMRDGFWTSSGGSLDHGRAPASFVVNAEQG